MKFAHHDLWFEVKAIANILRGEIAVAEIRQSITNPADMAELRRMLEEVRRFLATPEGEDHAHATQDARPPLPRR